MAKRIILLSGPIASGKSTLARALSNRCNVLVIQTRELLSERLARSGELDRLGLQAEGDMLDMRTDGKWVRYELERRLRDTPEDATILVDSVRRINQIDAIREAYGSIVSHIHLTAPLEVLALRYLSRADGVNARKALKYEDVRSNQTERLVERLQEAADLVIDTSRCSDEDVRIRAAFHLGLYIDSRGKCLAENTQC